MPVDAVIPLIIAGVVLIAISLLAMVGAACAERKAGRALLYAYGSLMAIIIILEVAAAAAVLVGARSLQDDAARAEISSGSEVDMWINSTYNDCCNATIGAPLPPSRAQTCWVPAATDIVTAATCASVLLFKTRLLDWLTRHLTPIGAVALSFAGIQLFAVCATCCSARAGRRAERRKREEEASPFAYAGAVHSNPGGAATLA